MFLTNNFQSWTFIASPKHPVCQAASYQQHISSRKAPSCSCNEPVFALDPSRAAITPIAALVSAQEPSSLPALVAPLCCPLSHYTQ
eukprot:2356339-Amphidinium_carterae.1